MPATATCPVLQRREPAGRPRGDLRDPRAQRRGQDDTAAGPVRDGPRARHRTARRHGRCPAARPDAIARQGVAHVPEGRGTFMPLTVEENLRLGAYGTPAGPGRRGAAVGRPGARLRLLPRAEDRGSGRSPAASAAASSRCSRSAGRSCCGPGCCSWTSRRSGSRRWSPGSCSASCGAVNEEERTTVVVVEQNAHLALGIASRRTSWRPAGSCCRDRRPEIRADEQVAQSYLGYRV